MQLKITYDSETRAVVSYSCVPISKMSNNTLQENQVYISGSTVPVNFYTNYKEYSITDSGKLLRRGKYYSDQLK